MNTGSSVLIAIFILLILILGIGYYWVINLQAPSPGNSCSNSDWLWIDNCLGFQELNPDPTLLSPSNEKLYLVKFANTAGAGPPMCKPMWYRFRYVNVKTGGYSPFSAWTTNPIFAGANNLPCLQGNGNCPTSVPEGSQSCQFNAPTVGIPSLLYSPTQPTVSGSFIYANVHRYT